MKLDFRDVLEEKTRDACEVINRGWEKYKSTHEECYVATVLEAMEYSILAGGKRLRPLLMKETFELFADGCTALAERRRALDAFMTALEMIHTYSLVHDDLPAMDNDSFRRGKETTWKVYGDGMGVLTGDALLNAAFEISFQVLAEAAGKDNVDMTKDENAAWLGALSRCGVILSEKAGVPGMLGGQVADVESEKKRIPMTQDRIMFIHTYKTAALIEAAMSIGAILAGAEASAVKTVAEIARKVGIAFQIQDDILDVEGNSAELGKPIGSDEESGKETYVTLKGLEESHREVERLSKEAVAGLESLPGDHTFLKEWILYLIYRKK